MFKKLIPFAAAAALFFSAEGLQAQAGSGCSKSASECSKKCDGNKQKKAEETIQFSTVTHEQLMELMGQEGTFVIDARGEESYNAGHIDGAVLYANFTLPENKSTPIIFYCGGPKCSLAPKAARKAIESGYDNVMVYHGGWMEWNEQASSQAGL